MNRKIKGLLVAGLMVLLLLSYSTLANAQSKQPQVSISCSTCPLIGEKNVLSNPNFNIVGPNGPSTTFTGTGYGGYSSAANWTVFNNKSATTNTKLVPSTFPSGGSQMIHVTTTSDSNGLVQVYRAFNTGPKRAIAGIWVFVRNGKVGMGIGNGGNTSIATNTISSTINQWEHLQSQNLNAPANEFIIYSIDGPADFYVASACITEVPPQ
jgi:hypothetical protein